jgi:1-acyl-sn-glycerol-3-phosphate acyltransferase
VDLPRPIDVTETIEKLPTDPDRALEALTGVVAELVRQTHPTSRVRVLPDSALESDLGLDSLARIELLHRVEDAFGVRLDEEALLAIETPRELLKALAAASGDTHAAVVQVASAPVQPAIVGSPERARTLTEMLEWHAAAHGERRHVRFYASAERAEDLTYAGLLEGARAVAAGLIAQGVQPHQTVALMLPTGLDFLMSFYGILLAGGVPVPIYPPARLSQIEDHLRRQSGILSSAQCVLLITVPEARMLARFLRSKVDSLNGVVTVEELRAANTTARLPQLDPGDVAFIQYTSGSTGSPKGVVLTHANLLANIRAWGAAVRLSSEDVAVSWLPLYHDMGLIGAWLGSLYHGGLLVLMSPLDFLARPERWLQAIHRHRGTCTAAPNFAFELCVRRVPEEVLKQLDLSCWRLAANGAEPVSADTLARFAERFAPCGFRREALAPVYGLAECTVGLALPPLDRGPVIDRVQRAALIESGRALPAEPDDPHALRYVACGHALPGHELRIVDDGGREVGERVVGRLQFRGPSATSGYFRNPEETRTLFDGPWLNTGDVGYLAAGDLYITSRVKDMIIRGGHNLYPYELEEAVGDLDGVRKGCVAVVGVPDLGSGTERLAVIAEVRARDAPDPDALRERIARLSIELLGSPPDDIVLAPPNSVLKTSSGKIRRAATRDRYVAGAIGKRGAGFRWQVVRLAVDTARSTLKRGIRRTGEMLYALYAWLLFVVLAPPAWTFGAVLRPPERAWNWCGRVARVFFRLLGNPLAVRGIERLPRDTNYVLVVNHGSYLDGILLVGYLPRQHDFIAKREFVGYFISRRFLAGIGSLFVERHDAARGVDDVRRFTAVARQGRRIAIFPEGTFTRQTGLRPFRMGAFVMAAEAGIPVVPVAIRGARDVLRDGYWMPRRGSFTITVGAPIHPSGSNWEAAVELRERARAFILEHCGESSLLV